MIDKKGQLDDEVFTCRVTKDKKIFIFCHGKVATILKDRKAEDFIANIERAEGKDVQLVMARATGHFKHGNERAARDKRAGKRL